VGSEDGSALEMSFRGIGSDGGCRLACRDHSVTTTAAIDAIGTTYSLKCRTSRLFGGTVTPEVAGSSPVGSAKKSDQLQVILAKHLMGLLSALDVVTMCVHTPPGQVVSLKSKGGRAAQFVGHRIDSRSRSV
jgi:hypothetical protein